MNAFPIFRSGRLLFGLAALAAVPGARGADDVTLLDPVFVEASSGTPWHYIAVPGFEVLSHCPDAFNRDYAHALRSATAARLALLPESFWGDMPTPMKIILYDRKPDDHEGFRSRSPIDLSWDGESAAVRGAEAIMLSHPLVVGDGDTFISCGNYWDVMFNTTDLSVDPDSEVRLRNRAPRLPGWFVAGVVGPRGIYVNHRVLPAADGETLVLRSAVWENSAATIDLQQEEEAALAGHPHPRPHVLLPLAELFGGTVKPAQEDLWNAEAALFVRWGLYESGNRAGFLALVEEACQAPVTEDVLKRCLGLSSADVHDRLAAFLPAAVSDPITVALPAAAHPPLRARNATSAEVARIIGDWGRLESLSLGIEDVDYQQECLEQAERVFARNFNDRNSDPLFLASYGLFAAQEGKAKQAEAALGQAVRAGVLRPRAYVELARLKLEAALPPSPHGIGDLGEAEFTEITALLATARHQMPSLLSSYQVLARALAHAPATPTRADLWALEGATRYFPANVPFAHRVAALYVGAGYPEEATAIVNRSMKFAGSDAERAFLSSVFQK
jgi:hypothetical protein